MNHRKVAVLFPPTEQIYICVCDYYGDTLGSTLLKRAREANSWKASEIFSMYGTISIRIKAIAAVGMISWRLSFSQRHVVLSKDFSFSEAIFEFAVWRLTDVGWVIFLSSDAISFSAFPVSEQISVHGSWILLRNSLGVWNDQKKHQLSLVSFISETLILVQKEKKKERKK